jgi:Methyltransferase domain
MHIWGWMTPEQLDWLGGQAAQMNSVVEVGCLRGRSAFALITACDGPVYCIDPWPEHYESFMSACGHFPNLVAIRASSPEAAEQVPQVDMVFLDGDHEYAAVVADIEAWLPKTRRLLCGHDYGHPDYPGVAEAVDAIFADAMELAGPGHLASIWTVPMDQAPAARMPRRPPPPATAAG